MTAPLCAPPRATVLFVDDEERVRRALERLFRSEPVEVRTASGAEEALALLEREPVHVVVSDQRMPGMTGARLLERIREDRPDIIRVLMTGYTGIQVAVDAINRGEIFRLITKPWGDAELRATIRQAAETFAMRREIERLNRVTRKQKRVLEELTETLEGKVTERTREVREKHRELRLAYVSTVRALAEAVDAKDAYTRGHSERVGVYAARIARELGCGAPFVERIYLAGLLHDIGKIGIPDSIILKPSRLTAEEYGVIQKHPQIGARILEPVEFLSDVATCVRHHHEWYDGSERGYPDRLLGSTIPLPSRIILVSDTVEAMTSNRPYRAALPFECVIEEVRKFSGSQFDPEVADAFLAIAEREDEGFLERASKFDIEDFLAEATTGS